MASEVRRTFSCCTLPFSTSLSFRSASTRASSSLFRAFCKPCTMNYQCACSLLPKLLSAVYHAHYQRHALHGLHS